MLEYIFIYGLGVLWGIFLAGAAHHLMNVLSLHKPRKDSSAVERRPYKARVQGSIPCPSTRINMKTEVKAEDLQVGDQMYPRTVIDLFYRTNTLARTNKSSKGLVVVVFDDFSTKAFPMGHVLKVWRSERTEPDG